jgi:hypothetical protein
MIEMDGTWQITVELGEKCWWIFFQKQILCFGTSNTKAELDRTTEHTIFEYDG